MKAVSKWIGALLALLISLPSAAANCWQDLASDPRSSPPSEIASGQGVKWLAVEVALDKLIGDHQGPATHFLRGLYFEGAQKHDINHLTAVKGPQAVKKMTFVFSPRVLDAGDWWVAKKNSLQASRPESFSPSDSMSAAEDLKKLFAGELETAAIVLGYAIPLENLAAVVLPPEISAIQKVLAIRLKMMGIDVPIIIAEDLSLLRFP